MISRMQRQRYCDRACLSSSSLLTSTPGITQKYSEPYSAAEPSVEADRRSERGDRAGRGRRDFRKLRKRYISDHANHP